MYTYWKIERYAFDDTLGTHSSTVTDTITGFFDVIVRTRLGSGRDTFEFKQLNNNGDLDTFYTIGDKLVIYYKVNSSTVASSDIIMTAVVNDLPYMDDVKNVQRVQGNNYSETLMNAIAFTDGSETQIPQFIQNALNSVNNYSGAFNVTWSSTTNPSVKTNGDNFPNGERWFNKSMLQLLERYSSRAYNKDTDYYWYVNPSNELIWIPQTQDVTTHSFATSTANYLSLRAKKDTKDVINFVIVKGDTSPSGKVIQARVDNAASRVKNGFKPYIITSAANYAKTLVETDRAAYPTAFDEGDVSPNTYNFTTAWKSSVNSSDPSMTAGSTVTVTSAKNYNKAVTNQAVYNLKQEANRFLEERGEGKLQVEIKFKPGQANNGDIWRIGNLVNVTIPELGKVNDPMRVESAEYSSTSETYVLIEDEGSI